MINTSTDAEFVVVIPARYGSSRFPGKPLADIHGKPMIQHVYERAKSTSATQVVVATDDQRIADCVASFGGEVCMTRDDHESGTERIAEVIQLMAINPDTVVVNVQGDEPFIPSDNIQQVANNLAARSDFAMATLATGITESEDIDNPNAVKVVADNQGKALYFSRASIPFDRDGRNNGDLNRTQRLMMRHIGIYAYRAAYVKQYVDYAASELEQVESLEQLRALWNGDAIHVALAVAPPPIGIDTPEDLARITQQNV